MAVISGTNFEELMTEMGFVNDGTDKYYYGADTEKKVKIEPTSGNVFNVYCSDGATSGYITSGSYSGYPLKIEYFELKNGGVCFRAKYVHYETDAIAFPFCFCVFKNANNEYEYIYRAYIMSSYKIYHDNNGGRVTELLAPTASFLTDSTANVISLSGLYNQVDGFLPDDIKLCTICSNTLAYSKSYGVTIDGDTYVMGMSESDSSSGGVGGRIAFRVKGD